MGRDALPSSGKMVLCWSRIVSITLYCDYVLLLDSGSAVILAAAVIDVLARILDDQGIHRPGRDHVSAKSTRSSAGAITFEGYSTSYAADGEQVLRDLNLDIRGGEKIGICGRTGAGKSSITLALFRILEATQGRILIDRQHISKV
ncbi:ATP-binding cassette glutathione S-conjugate transporter ycf1 [Sorochytrium milnesiophthora]